MTDVLHRTTLDPEVTAQPPVAPAPEPDLPVGARAALGSLAAAAGVIHLAMVPSHWDASTAEGVSFLLAGWTQLALAGALLVRPSRRVLAAAAVISTAFLAAWAVSRTAGLPYGAHPGHAEDVTSVDLVAVGAEAALVVACVGLLATGMRLAATVRWAPWVLAVGALVAGSAAVASPSARDHASHAHDDAAVEVSAGAAPAAHAHDEAAATGEPAAAEPVDDRGLSSLGNGHHHEIGPEQPLDRATRAELARQIAITQEVAATYPTVADAKAAGYRRTGPYSPGIGAHFIRTGGGELNPDGVMDEGDLRSPLAIIYDGTDDAAQVAGFMYYSMSAEEPDGFAGPNDVWHYHTHVCLKPSPDGAVDAPFGADTEVPAGVCEAAGGRLIEQTQWMVHVWSVPGWESQQGLFGEVNPALACPDGSYHQLPLDEWVDHPLNSCLSAA